MCCRREHEATTATQLNELASASASAVIESTYDYPPADADELDSKNCEKVWGDLLWEKSLISERKYIVPETLLQQLIRQQKCQSPGCGRAVSPTSVSSREMAAAVRYDYECEVIVFLCHIQYAKGPDCNANMK